MPAHPAPSLMVNKDGSVYHIAMKPENLADTVIVVGDPHRVHEIAAHFTGVEHEAVNREFVSKTGYFNGVRLTALSTGIGTDNCDIVMHELDALANFDLQTRQQLAVPRSLKIVRLGTSGALQPDIPVGSYALSTYAAGLDNLLLFYRRAPEILDAGMTKAFAETVSWSESLTRPYFVAGSEGLIRKLETRAVKGITITAPGFYGPQGRYLRLELTDPDMVDKLKDFSHNGHRVINFEMETSAIYGLGRLMNHETATICAIIANRATGEYQSDHKQTIRELISYVLESLTKN